jgi:hypothetical protein
LVIKEVSQRNLLLVLLLLLASITEFRKLDYFDFSGVF